MPTKFRDLVAVLRSIEGVTIEEPSSGSHWKVGYKGSAYPLSLHNGPRSELSDVYIKGVARFLGMHPNDLLKKIRS